jgi:amino acid permease
MTLMNIFHSGGLWLIPVLLLLASGWSFYRGYLSSRSNSTTSNPDTGEITDNTGNVPIYKTPQFIYGVVLFVISIIAFIWIGSDYRGV